MYLVLYFSCPWLPAMVLPRFWPNFGIFVGVGWLVLGLTALWDNISVYIGPSPKEREKEERKDRWE